MTKNILILFCAVAFIISCFVGAFLKGKSDFESSVGLNLSLGSLYYEIMEKTAPNYDSKVEADIAKLAVVMLDISKSIRENYRNDEYPKYGQLYSNGFVRKNTRFTDSSFHITKAWGERSIVVIMRLSQTNQVSEITKDACKKINVITSKYNGPKCLPKDAQEWPKDDLLNIDLINKNIDLSKVGDTVFIYKEIN